MTETPLKPRRVRMGEKIKYAYSLKTLRVREKDFPYNGNN